MSQEQPTATIRCSRCDGTGFVIDDDELEESCLAQEIEQGKIEEAEDEARYILSLIKGLSYAEQVKALGQHLLPFFAVMLAVMCLSGLSGCTQPATNPNDVLIMNHLKSFKQGDIIKMDGQPDYKFTIQDCYDIGYGKPSTHAIVYHIDELGMLHQDLVDLRVCTHAE